MIRYVFKEGPLTIKNASKADAQEIGDALEAIRLDAGGRLDTDRVWQTARDPKHVLHKHYEWDVEKAAIAHWRVQSRVLVQCIRIIDTDKKGKETMAPAFISVALDDGVSYRSCGDVRNSKDLRDAVMRRADKDLEAFLNRYRELASVCHVVRKARETLRRLREETDDARV